MRNEKRTGNKNQRVKRMLAVLALLCAVMIAGWTGAYAENAHPVSSIPFIREWIEESNRMDEEMEKQGYHAVKKILIMDFAEDDAPYNPTGTVTAEGNSVHATVIMRIEEGDSDESSEFMMTAALLANGKPVDFRMDESSSSEGILRLLMNSNRDYIVSLRAEDVPVVQGENKLLLAVFGYCKDQDFFLQEQGIQGTFVSDRAYDGTAVAACPEDEINVAAVQDRSGLGPYAGSNFISPKDMIDFQSDHYGHFLMTSKPEPVMSFYLDNMSDEGLIGNRKGIMFLLIDGEPQPVWNGNCFGEISLTDSDLLKVIQVKSGFQAGEEPHVYWCYQETEGMDEWPISWTFRMKMKIVSD